MPYSITPTVVFDEFTYGENRNKPHHSKRFDSLTRDDEEKLHSKPQALKVETGTEIQ